MKYYADFHIHSCYSRATSKALNLDLIYKWAQLKGLTVVGTSDFTHPKWYAELSEKLVPAEQGLYAFREDLAKEIDKEVHPSCRGNVRFVLTSEISTIYKKNDKVRKVHHLVIAPSLEIVAQVNEKLDAIGNIKSDGRPIIGIDSRDLLALLVSVSEDVYLVPAHIWTPHFSTLGSGSRFSTIEECYGDMSKHIFAVETGLSSDPGMNWMVSDLDKYALISNSDAHSAEKLARECNVFDTELSYNAMFDALKKKDKKRFLKTYEFFPEQGKYHFDGHRNCNVCLDPSKTNELEAICPECGKKVVVGVMNRVVELADRKKEEVEKEKIPYDCQVPLKEIISQIVGVGVNSKKVNNAYHEVLKEFGPELKILHELSLKDFKNEHTTLVQALQRMRNKEVSIKPGYDGEFGVITVAGKQV